MAENNRDKSAGADDWDDDSTEYEVEPPDPNVLAAEERRAEEIIAASQLAVELQEIYDEVEGGGDREYLDELVRGFRFRFRTKHLLVITTVVAVLIAMVVQDAFGSFFVLAMMLAVGGITAFLSWRQHHRELELDRRRRELFARQHAALQAASRRGRESFSTGGSVAASAHPVEKDSRPLQHLEPAKFRLRFTLAEMMVASVCAAVLFGLVAVWGLPMTATLVGLVALGGLVLHACGAQAPHPVVFGWWMLLLLYIVLSIIAAIWEGLHA